MREDAKKLEQAALAYHREPSPGKLAIQPTTPLATQRDLSLAYSPGVAAASNLIAKDPNAAAEVTARGNLVAVVSNGTAVLGLGAIGPLASKPVMEGKAVLFKKFAHIDCFDLEVDALEVDRFCDVVAALEPTFGAINLEDIKAPECFEIEKCLRERMNIPVFHDDQHGTAIVVCAAIVNGLKIVGKDLSECKIVSTGGGAAGLACLDLLVSLGAKKESIWLCDLHGLVRTGRTEGMDPYRARYAQDSDADGLKDVIEDADIFLGLSAPGVLTKGMVKRMGDAPIIMALANPTPEIMPHEAREVREDAIIATGRSDFPNQVNNVLCFPFIFRGALDVGATEINEEMKIASVHAIAKLAEAESSDVVRMAYKDANLKLGPDYILPKPFDPRLITAVAPAVAKAAMESGIATRPIEDFDTYTERLNKFVFRSGNLMQPIFERAKRNPKRVVFAEGESRRVLLATQVLVDEELAKVILVGRPNVIERRIEREGLRIKAGEHFEIVNPESDPRYDEYWKLYHSLLERDGVSPEAARTVMRTNTTAIAGIMVRRGEADAMVCGTYGLFDFHLRYVLSTIGKREGVRDVSALSVLILPKGTYFLCDTFVTYDPSAEEIAESVLLSAEEVRRFGITPKVALLSHSNFGSATTPSALKMRRAVELLHEMDPELNVEGEMHGDAAIDTAIRARIFPNSQLEGAANLLVMPSLNAANIAFELLKVLGNGLPVGPLLVGTEKPAHIVTPSVTARGLVNISALAVVDAQAQDQGTLL